MKAVNLKVDCVLWIVENGGKRRKNPGQEISEREAGFCFRRRDFFCCGEGISQRLTRGINTEASSSKTNNEYDSSKATLFKSVRQHMLLSPVIPYFWIWENSAMVLRKIKRHPLAVTPQSSNGLCLWLKGHAGFSIANVFSTVFVTQPPSESNYVHKGEAVAAAAAAAALYLKTRDSSRKALCSFSGSLSLAPMRPGRAQSPNT